MRSISPRTGFAALALLAVATVALPVASSGCGRTACFVFTQSEHDAHGACPGQQQALTNFTDPKCAGPVVSIDGEGVFQLNVQNPAESLCCYPVTQRDVDALDLAGDCASLGVGGAGGAGNAGGTITSVVAVGTGGGKPGGCTRCKDLLMGASTDPNLLCPGVGSSWAAVQGCGCGDAGPCGKLCALNLCSGAPISPDCLTCLDDTANSGCGPALANCDSG